MCLWGLLSGCAPRVVYKNVYVPTRCNLPMPARPHQDLGTLEYLKALLIYTESLERDLRFCTQDRNLNP
ncbi:hypothetical protein [Helicobacter baculiformis]|uniref:hypothetical protein n=1 Tax=Helicobacter baculiformis TaxID=427351 RepID=UPI0036D31097